MTRLLSRRSAGRKFAFCALARRTAAVAIVLGLVCGGSPALAAKKKTEEAARPTKSYTMSYMLVIALVSLGVMAVARPVKRADKPPERKFAEEE